MKKWLQDHFKWYRRMKGGRWAQWNSFWEQPTASGLLQYVRGKRRYYDGTTRPAWYAALWWDKIPAEHREEYPPCSR
ncbi:MAG: hypothetical protein EG825_07705 [Rhodocyclaceae bacterium]|nr:hypothetical protein [Rhodocyclaceae bacterium]